VINLAFIHVHGEAVHDYLCCSGRLACYGSGAAAWLVIKVVSSKRVAVALIASQSSAASRLQAAFYKALVLIK
jgi:hypothetical protein